MIFLHSPHSQSRPDATGTPFLFPEGRHGKGKLVYQEGIPILRVEGTPEEVGEQLAVLYVRPASRLSDFPFDLLLSHFRSRLIAKALVRRAARLGERLLAHFPEVARLEFDGMIIAGLDRNQMILGNTIYDLKNISLPQILGCSSLIVPASRSATGGPLFGRNLDFFSLGYLHEYSLVTIRPRTEGALAYATVGFPGTLGCFSGMNEMGLALASHEVLKPPRPRRFNSRGVPFTLAYRRVLEECSHTDEAANLLREIERTTSTILVLCDRDGGKTLEVSPDHVIEHKTDDETITCTNHYRTSQLANRRTPKQFRTAERLATLNSEAVSQREFAVSDLAATLDAVHQSNLTVQSMIFEPAAATIHVGFGPPPTTARAPIQLDLRQFWDSPNRQS